MFGFIFYTCKKNDTVQKDVPQNPESLIIEATSYFSKEVAENNVNNYKASRQKVGKDPLWDNAGIINFKRGKTVVVPLKFDKDIHFQSSFGDSSKMSLEKQSYLFMNKDANNRFKTEVVMYIPDKYFLEHKTSGFSGVVKVENWEGSAVNTFLFKDNKTYKFKSRTEITSDKSNLKTSATTCYYINWYDCDELSPGSYYNCQLIGTDFLGCYEEEQEEISWIDDDPLGGSGNYTETAVAPELQVVDGPLNIETVPGQAGDQRERNYKYEFLKNATVSFVSYDKSIQKKGSDGLWRFHSLQHTGDAMIGFVVGWNISYSLQGYVPTVGQFYSSANFDCIVTFSKNVYNIPVSKIQSYHIPKYFHVNDGN